jgi:hypothetical protein
MSTSHPTAHAPHAPHTPRLRAAGLAIVLSALVAVIVLAFAWPGVTANPKNVPLGAVGPDAAVSSLRTALDHQAGGVFHVAHEDDRAAAVNAIEHRKIYGAVVLGEQPEVLTASAASPLVAQQLSSLASALGQKMTAEAAAQAPAGATPPVVTVRVTDVVPLAHSDPRGTGLIAAALPLVLGGLLGGIVITVVIVGALRRLMALLIYAVVASAGVVAILQAWLGVLQGNALLNAGVFALALLAIGAPIVGFAALVGRPGLAIGPVVFLLFANPISSAAQPVEFLAVPWGAVGQWFPPGAGATLIRDASYFPHADVAFPWLVLAGWAVAGVVLALAGHFRATGGATREAIQQAVVAGDPA